MTLTSPRFSGSSRLQRAAENDPPLRRGDWEEAVRLLQQALVDVGYPMPRSTRRYGSPDGVYGGETDQVVRRYQRRERLGVDGVAGRRTLGRLDAQLRGPAAPLPRLPKSVPYDVPGLKLVIAQPSGMSCWATVYAMLLSWKDSHGYPIRDAVHTVGSKYSAIFDADTGLPSAEFGPFLAAAGMRREPMSNLSIEQWANKLRAHGLLWVGALNSLNPGAGLHSRIVEGMRGDGTPGRTWMKIIDPAGGRRYEEGFMTFVNKYEGAIVGIAGEYFQIRHF